MKNSKYFPFERNKYFYGKLLTVDDFEIEQRYMNDKRRMINRFMYGTGVVCGMNVVQVDDTSVSIEQGLALDNTGREIVVDMPVVKRLSTIDGFEKFMKDKNNKPYLYLCIDYDEKEKEEVYNVTSGGSIDYGRYREGFKLSISTAEPVLQDLSSKALYQNTAIVYEGNNIKISQITPTYINSDDEFEIKIIVENLGQTNPISFKYTLNLECLEFIGQNNLEIEFNETDKERKNKYELYYTLKAIRVNKANGLIELKDNNIQFFLADKMFNIKTNFAVTTKIISHSIEKEIRDNYYKIAMDDILNNNYQTKIYIAKIYIIRAGNSYIIDKVENLPFNQGIYNNVLSDAISQFLCDKQNSVSGNYIKNRVSLQKNQLEAEKKYISTGYTIFDLGIGGTTGQKFFSEDICHNLGVGKVTIILGQCVGITDDDEVIYGSPEVYEDDEDTVIPFRAETAAKLNPIYGTFQIGIRLIEPTMTRYVRVDWTAIRDPKEEIKDVDEKAIFIKPQILYLSTRQSYYLEAKFQGIQPTEVIWTVNDKRGGTIDENGKYTAPNIAGIYEVTVRSKVYDDLWSSIFVVVRDNE